MKAKKRKTAIIVALLVAGVVVGFWVYKVAEVNREYPQASIEHIPCGTETSLENGVKVRVKNTEFLTSGEYIKRYGKNMEISKDEDLCVVLATISLKNPTTKKQAVDICQFYIEKEGYYNGMALDTFLEQSKGEDTVRILGKSEEQEVTLPYILYAYQFKQKDWKQIQEKQFYLVNQRYPVKICWDL